jgi:uncharacterized coiled-coil DUF342 family protein
MPNKTIYVKDADVSLLEKAQAELGESVSSLFAEFLRQRMTTLTPVERQIIERIKQIAKEREALKEAGDLPDFVDGEFAEADKYAQRALESLRAAEIKKAKTLWYASNTFYARAERSVKEIRELGAKIASVLET